MIELCSFLLGLLLLQTPAADTTGRIAGRVTLDGTGTPISGARVLLMPAAPGLGQMVLGPMGPPQATTDQDGRYTFERLGPGSYRIQVEKTGYAPMADESRSRTVEVVAGRTTQGVDVVLQKGAVITGKVLDPAGEPLPDARVMALRRASPQGLPPRLVPTMGGQQTNDLGEFRIAGLPAGEYYVAALPRPASMFGGPGIDPPPATPTAARGKARTATATTFYPGTSDQAAAQPVAVVAGAEAGNIIFTMQTVAAFRVSGVVVDEEGKPVAGAVVMLMGNSRDGMFMGPTGNARTQESGRFDIDDVPAGSYRANASIPITFRSAGGTAGGAGGGAAGFGTVVSGGVIASGGYGRGSWTSMSSSTGGEVHQPVEVVVADADVSDVRVTVRRPSPR